MNTPSVPRKVNGGHVTVVVTKLPNDVPKPPISTLQTAEALVEQAAVVWELNLIAAAATTCVLAAATPWTVQLIVAAVTAKSCWTALPAALKLICADAAARYVVPAVATQPNWRAAATVQ